MIKAVLSGSFDFHGVPVMKLAELHSKGLDRDFMTKRAAVLNKEMAELRPEKGMGYIHLIALGDQEIYGLNRNGDGFPKSANEKYHHTFVKHANVFKHHKNKDPKEASGKVAASAYNPGARRVELIIGVNEEKWAPELQKLAEGGLAPVSMACRVPWDECTYCDHRAKSRAEYCGCLKYNITKVASNGVHIGAVNYDPTFFDISSVLRNADRIAFGLRKVAAEGGAVSGAELAEEFGLVTPLHIFEPSTDSARAGKMAALTRLAKIEKEIDGVLSGICPDHRGIKRLMPAVKSEPISEKDAQVFHRVDPKVLFGHLAKEGVCLPIEDFYQIIFGPRYGDVSGGVKQAKECLPGIFSKLADDPEKAVSDASYDSEDKPMPTQAKIPLAQLARKMSMRPGATVKRITIIKIQNLPVDAAAAAPEKTASAEANFLASEYAKYKLAFVNSAGIEGNEGNLVLTALQNYVR